MRKLCNLGASMVSGLNRKSFPLQCSGSVSPASRFYSNDSLRNMIMDVRCTLAMLGDTEPDRFPAPSFGLRKDLPPRSYFRRWPLVRRKPFLKASLLAFPRACRTRSLAKDEFDLEQHKRVRVQRSRGLILSGTVAVKFGLAHYRAAHTFWVINSKA